VSQTIYGINTLRAALEEEPERIHKFYVIEGSRNRRLEGLVNLARTAGVPLVFQPREALDRLAGADSHQGAVATVTAAHFTGFDELIERALKPDNSILVALDHVQDPHNLGAVIRSAEATGASGVIVPRHRSALPGSAADKAAAGAIWRIPLARVSNLAATLETLKKSGFWVVGTAAEEGESPWKIDLKGKIVIVIGGEEKGIRPAVRSKCDHIASIPLQGGTSSLNASVAAGMMLYEALRQRISIRDES
jgi:23S rRNA (guanosine2251-2'-O)-methyltransferase